MLREGEIVVDSFAGGGGASAGIERALGRPVDVALNHDPTAIAVHKANHPTAEHHCQDAWRVHPEAATRGRPVGLAWFSPDCTHHSKARGHKPVRRRIRDLAWVVTRWAKVARPRVIMLENVEEFREWGPINERGKPIIDKAGATFRRWINEFERLGYQVDWRELVASDYGAPTKRKRLFVVARRDGAPIRWPEPTHGLGGAPVRCAADIVDWSVPCPSIFERRRPLAAATMRRAALGVERFVTSPPSPHLAPWPERLADGATAPVAAFMAQHNTGLVGHAMDRPVSTIVQRGSTQALVTCLLARADGALSGGPRSPSHAESVRALLRSEGCGVPEVHLRGELHVVADVRMRMLTPRELFMAQGFNSDYVIDGLFNGRGRPITKGEQAALCGNSVCPPVAEALVHSQFATARSGPYSEAA